MRKTKAIGLIIVIVIIAVIVLIVAQMLPSSGYKVTINGQAGYGTIGGWGLQYGSYTVTEDTWSPFGIFPWETGSIVVDCYLSNGFKTYHGSQNIGWVSNINPLAEYRDFHVSLRRVQTGSYTLHIDVYEIDYPLGIPLMETGRTLVKSGDYGSVTVH